MLHLLQLLIKNCKLVVEMGQSRMRITASGPIALLAAVVVLIVWIWAP